MMKPSDFEIRRFKIDNGHIDCWFNISGETADELTKLHMEQSMVCVSGCFYSTDEDILGIEKVFPWNTNVEIVDNEEMKNIIKTIISNTDLQKWKRFLYENNITFRETVCEMTSTVELSIDEKYMDKDIYSPSVDLHFDCNTEKFKCFVPYGE